MNEQVIASARTSFATREAALTLGAVVHESASLIPLVRIPLAMVNRHGLIAGATGTGKTKTLQLIAEQLSAQGVPCFLADVKAESPRRELWLTRRPAGCQFTVAIPLERPHGGATVA